MIRGTTPTHTFRLPFNTSEIKTLHILYAQRGQVILTKTESNCEMTENTVIVKLSQNDTLLFDDKAHVEIQVRVLTTSGDALASVITKVDCYKCLEDDVLT